MPDGPIGTRKHRVRRAIHLYWTRDLTQAEIAERLGVSQPKVNEYIHESPQSEAVQEQLEDVAVTTRFIAVQKLREQLRTAGERARTAEKPVAVWTDDDGNLTVRDQMDEDGEVVDKYPVPDDMEMGADEERRYYGRQEVREILDQLTELTGAKAPEERDVNLSGEMSVDVESMTEAMRDARELGEGGGDGE